MIVEIPQSTALRWVRVNSDGTALTGSLPNYTNRLNYHWTNVPNSSVYDYGFQFITNDIVQNQFTTDADTITIGLYNYDDDTLVSDLSGDETNPFTYNSGPKIYDLDIDTALLGGRYYVRYTLAKSGDPTEYWQSERFDVDAFSTDNTVKFAWANNTELGVYNPTGKYYYFRLPARFYKPSFGEEKETYTDSDEEIKGIDGRPILNMLLEIGEIPFFIAEKVNLGLQHYNLQVNDESYQTNDNLELEVLAQEAYTTNIVVSTVNLRKVQYQNQFSKISDDIPAETFCILINTSGDRLLWNATDCILWQ